MKEQFIDGWNEARNRFKAGETWEFILEPVRHLDTPRAAGVRTSIECQQGWRDAAVYVAKKNGLSENEALELVKEIVQDV